LGDFSFFIILKKYKHAPFAKRISDGFAKVTGHGVNSNNPARNYSLEKRFVFQYNKTTEKIRHAGGNAQCQLKRFETVFPACGSANSAIELTIAQLEAFSGFVQWVDVCKGYEQQ
jgi:hypothetical protein